MLSKSYNQTDSPAASTGNHSSESSQASKEIDGNSLSLKTVCIAGSAGKIAYAFLPLLCSGEVFGPETLLNVKLLTTTNSVKKLQGIVWEIEDCAYENVKSISFGTDPSEAFRDCDFIISFASAPKVPGMERKDLLRQNASIMKGLAEAIEKVAPKHVRVVIVSNPVNSCQTVMIQHAPSIPATQFTGVSLLDYQRGVSLISRKLGLPISALKNLVILGNHSRTVVVETKNATVEGTPLGVVINDQDFLKTELQQFINQRGFDIIEAMGTTALFSVAHMVKEHVRALYFGTKEGEYIHMVVQSDGAYGIPEGLMATYPLQIQNLSYKILKGFELDEDTKGKIEITIKELNSELEMIKGVNQFHVRN